MSTGTNQERLEQNNLLLEDIKEQIHNLPEEVISQQGYDTAVDTTNEILGDEEKDIEE